MKPTETDLAPGLLIALPKMQDDNFAGSVVLLIEHGSDGAMGLIVNRPAEGPELTDVARSHDLTLDDSITDLSIYQGGFVEAERGFLLHNSGEIPDSIPVMPGVYLASTVESLDRILTRSNGADFKLCLGYAGWSTGQLEREICEGLWLPAPATSQCIFDRDIGHSWENALRTAGIEPGVLLKSTGRQ